MKCNATLRKIKGDEDYFEDELSEEDKTLAKYCSDEEDNYITLDDDD